MNTMNATQMQGKDTNTRNHNPIRFAPVGSNNQSNRILGERPLGRITKGEIGKRMLESKSKGESMMWTSLLLIQPLYLKLHTYKDPSQDLVPNNLTIRDFRFLELFLIYMRI